MATAAAMSTGMAAGEDLHDRVAEVHLLHAELDVDLLIRPLKDGMEDFFQLDHPVIYRRHAKGREDGAAETILTSMEGLRKGKHDLRGVIIFSHRMCEVMKNNKQVSRSFQAIIQNDLAQPKEDRQFAVLWAGGLSPSDPIFREAFSAAFVEHFNQHRTGVNCSRNINKKEMEELVDAVTKQWFGEMDPPTNLAIPDIELVRIIHGGAKQEVREVSRELEDGFELEDQSKYKLFNRVTEGEIPRIILSEVRHIHDDGDNALGVVIWCPKLFRIMGQPQSARQFEELLYAGAVHHKIIHLCVNIASYEVFREFPKLKEHHIFFLPMTINEDGTLEVKDLTQRIKAALSQCPPSRAQVEREYQLSMTDTDSSLPPQNRARPPNPSGDRKSSEISEPGALASVFGQPAAQQRMETPIGELKPTVNIIGNPSNQNYQGGGRVAPSKGDSHSEHSAGYSGEPHHNGRMQAQPSDDSSSEGHHRVVANNGDSYERFPSSMDMGSYHLPTGVSNEYSRPVGNGARVSGSHAAGGVGGVGGVHLQATSSESSSDCSKVLADGEHSMPNLALRSGTFGSLEPVLPTRDMTMESTSMGPSGASQRMVPNFGNNQRFSSLEGNASSAVSSYRGPSIGPESSQAPATDRWAPSDCRSTEMPDGGRLPYNESVLRGAEAALPNQPRSLEDTAQRPAASKIPRRHNSGDASSSSFSQSSQSEYPASTPHHSLPSVSSSRSTMSGQRYQQPPSATASGVLSPGSMSAAAQSSDSCNISGLASDLNHARPFVQCDADNDPNGGELAFNPRSNDMDAFNQQDDRELGRGQFLPNQAVAPEFASMPPTPAGQQVREPNNQNDQERCSSSPARIPQAVRDRYPEISDESRPPPEQFIKDMNYRLREMLKFMLDPDTITGSNWKVFAHHFGMKYDLIRYLSSRQEKSQTLELLDWLARERPQVTCGEFKKVAKEVQRLDVVRKMNKFDY